MNYIENSILKEGYYEINHPTGLKIYIYPKKDSNSSYAVFGTKYGSIDTQFRIDGEEWVRVPEGIAHFLEHKLFESEDGDAFSRYAKTGASANAFTSFDRTCYLFSAAQNFDESLEILLDFVQHPYFTEQTVQKEQGIIGQEIKMYEDDPGWRVYFNLLGCLYHNHPVRIEIAGTIESIAKIDAELLYQCYKTFYNLNNMSLAVIGNVTPEQVLKIADKTLKQSVPIQIERRFDHEPDSIVRDRAEQKLAVAVPMFMLGYKENIKQEFCSPEQKAEMAILLELIAGKSSALYSSLLEPGLINESFSADFDCGRGYAVSAFTGESVDPDKTAQEIKNEIDRLRKNGIDKERFEAVKRKIYGSSIKIFDSNEIIGNTIIDSHFAGNSIFDDMDAVASCTLEQAEKRLNNALIDKLCALSVILPA